MNEDDHLRLAGVTRLSLVGGRGPTDAFLFDPHRLALPCWTLALRGKPPALLITLDRHLDLVPPRAPNDVPDCRASLREIDEYTRWELDVRNVDHILAAMESGLIGDAVILARSRPKGCLTASEYIDRRGQSHALLIAPTVARVAEGFGRRDASPDARALEAMLAKHADVILDVDLDCFTTPNDADPMDLLSWSAKDIRAFLFPEDSAPLWTAVLERCRVLTLAREPHHIGGVVAAHALFDTLAPILFQELLGVDVP